MMRQQQTSVNPLILNFLQPKQMEVISENETKIVYDPENHISMYFGGGNSWGTTSIRNAREIIIDDEEEVLIYRKPKLIGAKETRVKFGAIGSITVDKHILFADIIIETRGGREIVA